MINSGPFWSLYDPRRPAPNYLVDRTGPEWSFILFPTESKAQAFSCIPQWRNLRPIEIKTYEELIGLLHVIRDVVPQLKRLAFHEILGKPKRRMISRLPEFKTKRNS